MNCRLFAEVALGALALLALSACQDGSPSRAAAPPDEPVAHIVRQASGPEVMELQPDSITGLAMAQVQQVELPGILETTGQITFDDRRTSNIVSRVQGRIEQVRVSLWDNVHRGEQILSLYSPDFMTAEAEYLQAKQAGQQTDAAGAGEVERALLESARRKLELLGMEDQDIAAIREPSPVVWMRAPISGTVVTNSTVRGGAVNPGDVLYSLGTLDHVWITADIFEDELSRVQVGQQLEATTITYPDQVYHGVVTRISPGVDPNLHTIQIRCEVPNPGLKLKPQMLARVKIVVRPGTALVVPIDALVFETENYFAYVDAGGGRLERRQVSIAAWDREGYARIISGLSAGDRVVTGETLQVNALWHQAHGESS